MKRLLLYSSLFFCAASLTTLQAQTEVTVQEAKSLYKNTSKQRTSVHDPSVVFEPSTNRYYIFGSHKSGAYSTDLQNWTWAAPTWTPSANSAAFVTPEVKKVKKGGTEVDMPAFNAMEWAARGDNSYNIDGNMWAPDVLWNEKMQKWCMYLSINGDKWHSSIILLTSNVIQGPYKYQAPIVISGFDNGTHSYKDTDLEIVLGTQSSLPSRYNSPWATTSKGSWPNNIDPCVFYDEEGKLWMAYGSWSGGVWMLELDEETGLRDYDVTYSVGTNSDPYFGKRIAGGYYVSGEGAYIEHIGQYYYLFMSYGGLEQKGGYEMRVFRSENPDGPYLDPGKRNAVFSSYTLNFGPKATARGAKLIGPYSHWGYMPQGERSQGHNSIIAAPDGRTYLVYHTRFCNDDKRADEGHQVRVHQVFVNKEGWLVAAPFEYNGEQVTDADIAGTQPFTFEELCGKYNVLIHKFANDHNALEQVEPVLVTLEADGTVTGDLKGSWAMEEGTGYVTLTLGNVTYSGVTFEETMDERNLHATAITALSASGIGLWAYKLHPKYAVAWQLNNQKVPVTNNREVKANIDLYSMDLGIDNVSVEWTSSEPGIISSYGRYNPTGTADDTPVTLGVKVQSAGYYWAQEYNVKALSEEHSLPSSSVNWNGNMLAHYGFDDANNLANSFNAGETAQLNRALTTALPTVDVYSQLRTGNQVHLNFGGNGRESYVTMPNPLFGRELADGATIAFWVQRNDDNLWDALFGLVNGTERFYLTGNLYLGYNDGKSGADNNWLDINHPQSVKPTNLTVGKWNFVTITIEREATATTGGITIYVNGFKKSTNDQFNGKLNGAAVSGKAGFDYNLIVSLLAGSTELNLGKGSFWGSPDAYFDDVLIYDRALTSTEVLALSQMTNRVFDFTSIADGIIAIDHSPLTTDHSVYDLQGRRVNVNVKKGLYIINGRKTAIP